MVSLHQNETTGQRKEETIMLGAIFGDIVGSVYEFNNTHDPDFPLLTLWSRPTDDSIMSRRLRKR